MGFWAKYRSRKSDLAERPKSEIRPRSIPKSDLRPWRGLGRRLLCRSGHEKPRRTWTRSSVDVPIGCPLGTGMLREDDDCGTMWVSPHLLLASHRHYCGGTTLCHDLYSCVQDDWMCTWLHIPMTTTLWIFMALTTVSPQLSRSEAARP